MSVTFYQGVPINHQNVIVSEIKAKDDTPSFYVSYLKRSADYGCPTTAIVIEETQQHLILKGDHSEQLNGLNFQQTLDYFYRHLDQAHEYSEHGRIFKFTDEKKAHYIQGGY